MVCMMNGSASTWLFLTSYCLKGSSGDWQKQHLSRVLSLPNVWNWSGSVSYAKMWLLLGLVWFVLHVSLSSEGWGRLGLVHVPCLFVILASLPPNVMKLQQTLLYRRFFMVLWWSSAVWGVADTFLYLTANMCMKILPTSSQKTKTNKQTKVKHSFNSLKHNRTTFKTFQNRRSPIGPTGWVSGVPTAESFFTVRKYFLQHVYDCSHTHTHTEQNFVPLKHAACEGLKMWFWCQGHS